MKIFIRLLGVNFSTLLAGLGGSRSGGKKRGGSGIALLVLLGAIFLLYSGVYSLMLASQLAPLGLLDLQLALMAVVASVMVLMTSIQSVQTTLFRAHDLDLLLSMPIAPWMILGSKLVAFMLYEFVFSAVVMLPAGVVYFLFSAASPVLFLYLPLSVFLLPLIPIILATLIGSLFTWITNKLPIKSLLNNVFGIGFILVILVLSMNLNSSMEALTASGAEVLDTLTRYYPPAGWLTSACATGSPLDFLLFLLSSLVPFALFVAILSRFFKSLTTGARTTSVRRGGSFTMTAQRRRTPLKALLSREVSRYFSLSVYFINTAFGPILMTAAVVALLVMGPTVDAFLVQMPELAGMLPQLAAALTAFFLMMTCTTSCSISIEGVALDTLKSLPIAPRTLFLSKILLGVFVLLPLTVINLIVLAVRFSLPPLTTALLILACAVFSVLNGVVGLLANLRRPKLDWQTETIAVKQSMSVLFTMLWLMLLVVVPVVPYAFISSLLPFDAFLLILCALYGALLWLLWRRLNTKGAKRLLAI